MAQAGLADFGMCLISPLDGLGCVKTDRSVEVVDIDDAMTVFACLDVEDSVVDESAVVSVSITSLDCVDIGGLSEPGQGLTRGPCR